MKRLNKKTICKPDEKVVVTVIDKCEDTYGEVARKGAVPTQAITACLHNNYQYITNKEIMQGKSVAIRGVARCHDEDSYDEHRGIDLSSSRADMKYHKKMAKDYGTYIELLETALSDYKRLQSEHLAKVDNIERDIKRYYKNA
jgi:hypothetical protein